MGWSFHEGEADRNDVRQLLAFHFAEMRGASPRDACHVLEPDALAGPGIRFFTARDEAGLLLGCGALRVLDANHGEIKSMRTAPAALGRGVGQAMLDHIVAAARAMGFERLSLETGSNAPFAAAIRLYQRNGFSRSGQFGDYADNPFTRFFTREI